MKITKNQCTEPTFHPYTIVISVETYQDECALLKLSEAQYTVPELLYPCNRNPVYFNRTVNILNDLMKAIKL